MEDEQMFIKSNYELIKEKAQAEKLKEDVVNTFKCFVDVHYLYANFFLYQSQKYKLFNESSIERRLAQLQNNYMRDRQRYIHFRNGMKKQVEVQGIVSELLTQFSDEKYYSGADLINKLADALMVILDADDKESLLKIIEGKKDRVTYPILENESEGYIYDLLLFFRIDYKLAKQILDEAKAKGKSDNSELEVVFEGEKDGLNMFSLYKKCEVVYFE